MEPAGSFINSCIFVMIAHNVCFAVRESSNQQQQKTRGVWRGWGRGGKEGGIFFYIRCNFFGTKIMYFRWAIL